MPYKNIEDQRAYARKAAKRYAARHPEKVKARRARWGAANRDYERGRAKERKENLKAVGLCTWCGVNKTDGRVYCDSCREKNKKSYTAIFERDPEYTRKRHVWAKYRISQDDFTKMLEQQDNKCSICRRDQREFKSRLHIDHDHETGKIRGLLCFPCNASLPIVEYERSLRRPVTDEWKSKAREYLKRYK